jgi:hypothetical protein
MVWVGTNWVGTVQVGIGTKQKKEVVVRERISTSQQVRGYLVSTEFLLFASLFCLMRCGIDI